MFKIISDYMIFNKLCVICLKDNKIVNVIKIIKPKIEDDLELLNKSFDDISTLVLDGGYIPFKMDDDLFLAYCDFFYEKDIEKIEQIIKLNQKYYSILPKENNLVKEDLYNYYDETGLSLIKAGKLINKNLLTFLETRQKLLNREIKITEEITKGLIPSDDPEFLEYLMNINDISLIELSSEVHASIPEWQVS